MARFDTAFDMPVATAHPPVNVTSGESAVVRLVDHVRRTEHGLGRCEGSPALVGLKVHADQRVRVTVRLRAADATAEWWNLYAPPDAPRSAVYARRLLAIRSQGETRAAAVIARKPGDFVYDWRGSVSFDLPASALSEDGLLVVELAETSFGGTPHPAIGVAITGIKVEPATHPAPAVMAGSIAPDGIAVVAVGSGPWTFVADRRHPVSADPAPVNRGAPWGSRPPGAPKLRNREKLVALARRKVSDGWREILQQTRHALVSTWRLVYAPVAFLWTALLLRTATVTASVVPLSGGAPHPAEVRIRGLRRVEVRPLVMVTQPSVVQLSGRRFTWTEAS